METQRPPRSTALDAQQLLHSPESAGLLPLAGVFKSLTRILNPEHNDDSESDRTTPGKSVILLGRLLALLPVFTASGSDYALTAFNLRLTSGRDIYANVPKPLSLVQKIVYVAWFAVGDEAVSGVKDALMKREDVQVEWDEDDAVSTTTQPKWKQSLLTAINHVENILALASLANFILYLRYGSYRTLIERILNIRIIPRSKSLPVATASFDHMNRELVWRSLTEFISSMLPLLNLLRLQKYLSSLKSSTRSVLTTLKRSIASSSKSKTVDKGDASESPESNGVVDPACPICVESGRWTDIVQVCGDEALDSGGRIVAVSSKCMCFRAALAADPDYQCGHCGTKVEKAERCT
ncbi:peroxisome assembly protein (Peroxin-2) [Rhizoclosmatium sp. JEL0117]|nr:peroxisome assembly protein (Peroxin-2) [Rhizoclosmatium sp. JEL0117]